MRTKRYRAITLSRRVPARQSRSGFSLIELMVAMAIFLVIGGAAVSLVKNHTKLASSTQNQVGLNMALRNAISQMEVDVSNAGTGYFPGALIADWPIGITIANQSQAAACNTGTTYGANCFDTLNVVAADTTVPPLHPSASATGPVDVDTDTGTDVYLTPPATMTAAALAALFKNGDELLWLKPGSPRSRVTTTTLNADGVVSGSVVHLTFPSTTLNGINGSEKYLIANPGDNNDTLLPLTHTFVATQDWVLKLNPVVYSVDIGTASNPKLVRKQGSAAADVIAEQVVGFRVGASVRNGSADQPYNFNAAQKSVANGCTLPADQCGYDSDWSKVRAVRVSLIGRTPPANDPNNKYANAFDGGPYKIQGVSVTINPRNLSMNDQ